MAQCVTAKAEPHRSRLRQELYRRRLTNDAVYWFKELDLRIVSKPASDASQPDRERQNDGPFDHLFFLSECSDLIGGQVQVAFDTMSAPGPFSTDPAGLVSRLMSGLPRKRLWT